MHASIKFENEIRSLNQGPIILSSVPNHSNFIHYHLPQETLIEIFATGDQIEITPSIEDAYIVDKQNEDYVRLELGKRHKNAIERIEAIFIGEERIEVNQVEEPNEVKLKFRGHGSGNHSGYHMRENRIMRNRINVEAGLRSMQQIVESNPLLVAAGLRMYLELDLKSIYNGPPVRRDEGQLYAMLREMKNKFQTKTWEIMEQIRLRGNDALHSGVVHDASRINKSLAAYQTDIMPEIAAFR